jgi:hypothetical protein
LCLEHGADVNAVNSQGFSAVHGAANRGFDAMIRLLAEHGAKLDVKDKQGRTPMTFAEGVFLAGAKFSAHRLRIVRIVEHNCRDIGAPNAGNRQSIIGAPSGTSLPIYSTNS